MNKLNYVFKIIFFILLAMLIAWTCATVHSRIIHERKNNSVEICLDWNDIQKICTLNNYSLENFLQRCKAIGVASIALNEETLQSQINDGKLFYFPKPEMLKMSFLDILAQGSIVSSESIIVSDINIAEQIIEQLKIRYHLDTKVVKSGKYQIIYPQFSNQRKPFFWNELIPMGFSSEKIDFMEMHGFKVVLIPQNIGDPQWLVDRLDNNVSGFLLVDKEVPGYPGKETFTSQLLRDNKIKFINLEFDKIPGESVIEKNAPEQLVQGHVIRKQELNTNLNADFWVYRWQRAVKERSKRFLLIYFWDLKSIDDNFVYLRKTAQSLKKSGFNLQSAQPPVYPLRGNNKLWLLLVIITSIIIPLTGLYQAKKIQNAFKSFFMLNLFTISGGLLLSALLYDTFFMQKIIDIPAVKLTILLPLILSGFIIFSAEELHKFWSANLKVKHLVIAGLVLCAAAVALIRTGNNSADWLRFDQGLRQFIENVFSIRPRTKEFLIGQPVLFLGFYYRKPVLLWIGMISQVSIINTFMHAHSPVIISCIRTFHGLWAGLVIAYLIISILKLFPQHKKLKFLDSL